MVGVTTSVLKGSQVLGRLRTTEFPAIKRESQNSQSAGKKKKTEKYLNNSDTLHPSPHTGVETETHTHKIKISAPVMVSF